MRHSANTNIPTTVATKITDCLMRTYAMCLCMETAFRTMTSSANALSLLLAYVSVALKLHCSSIVHVSHVSFSTISYAECTYCMQYSNCAEPLQVIFTKNSSCWLTHVGAVTVKFVIGSVKRNKWVLSEHNKKSSKATRNWLKGDNYEKSVKTTTTKW